MNASFHPLRIALLLIGAAGAQLANPDFEKGLEGWGLFVPGESKDKGCAIEEGPGRNGTKGARMKSGAPARWGMGSGTFLVKPGERWRISFWSKNEGSSVKPGTPGLTFRLTMNDAAGKSTDAHVFVLGNGKLVAQKNIGDCKAAAGAAAEWTETSAVIEIPAGAEKMSPGFMPNGIQGAFLVDDVRVEKVADSVPVSPFHQASAAAVQTPAPAASTPEAPADMPSLTPTKERIAEIAAQLVEKPVGLGRPITDRKSWDPILLTPEGKNYLKQAENRLKTSPPVLTEELYTTYARKGTRPEWENPYAEKLNRVLSFALAECLENKGRFLEKIEEELPSILDEGTWVSSAHSGGDARHFTGELEAAKQRFDLGAGARASSLATMSYWLGDRLAPALRKRIYEEIKRRAWDPYLARAEANAPDGWWWMNGYNNWNAVVTFGVVGSALTLIEDRKERAAFVAVAERSMKYYMAGLADDGFCDEGVGYWHYGFGHYIMLQELIRIHSSGKIDAFRDQKAFLSATYPFRMEIGNEIYPAFGDSGVNSKLETDYGAYVARRYGIRQDILGANLKRWPNYGHPLGNHLARFAIAWFCDDVPKVPAKITPDLTMGGIRDAFEEGGVWVFRPKGANPFGLAVAIKGGHNNESHNHDDMGSYTLIQAGQNLLTDPGMDAYTKDTFSQKRYESEVINGFGHPVPVVAGFLQSANLLPNRQKERKENHAVVVSRSYSDAEDRLTLDLSKGYDYNVPELKKLHRTFIYRRTGATATLEIVDEVEFSEEKDFGSAIVTRTGWRDLGGMNFRVSNPQGAVKINVTSEGGALAFEPVERLKSFNSSGFMGVNRLGFRFEKPVTKAKIVYRVEGEKVEGSSVRLAPVQNAASIPGAAGNGLRMEAESLLREKGGTVEVVKGKTGASGSAFKGWDNDGHTIAWAFAVPSTGFHALRLKYCGDLGSVPSRRTVWVDGKQVSAAEMVFPSTGGWSSGSDDWKEVWLGEETGPLPIFLEAGRRELSLMNVGGALNLDWLELVPLARVTFGFEDGFGGWSVSDNEGMTTVSKDAARSGKLGIRVTDGKTDGGSSMISKRIPVTPGTEVEWSFWGRSVNGTDGLGLYLRYFDASGKPLNGTPQTEERVAIEAVREWKEYRRTSKAPEGSATCDLWLHSFNKAVPVADVDDVTISVK